MAEVFNENLIQVLHLADEMLSLADRGDAARSDDSCGILYGILRDSAYRLRRLARRECEAHRRLGKWDEDLPLPPAGAG